MEEVIKRFLQKDEIITTLFNEVPPVITLAVLYLEPVEGNVFTPKTAKLHLARIQWKSDDGEMRYGYHKNPYDTENKIISFLSQFENIEKLWLEEEVCCRTRYIGLKDDTGRQNKDCETD
jgi:hypothetical protein